MFLAVLVLSLLLAAFALQSFDLSFTVVASAVIAHDVALAALIFYLVWRSHERLAAIGWVSHGVMREVFLGVALYVPLFLGIAVVAELLQAAGLPPPPKPPEFLVPRTATEHLLALVFLTVVAVTEETIFRGYLLRRFTQITNSRLLAVVLSSTIFAFGHAYQGSLGIIAVGLIGVVFALVYLWRGSLVAPAVMHFIQDFIGIVVAPRIVG